MAHFAQRVARTRQREGQQQKMQEIGAWSHIDTVRSER